MNLAFTGHRPESLPYGSNELLPACVQLKAVLLEEIIHSTANGYDTFLADGARGGDIIFAEQVLLARATECPFISSALFPMRGKPTGGQKRGGTDTIAHWSFPGM